MFEEEKEEEDSKRVRVRVDSNVSNNITQLYFNFYILILVAFLFHYSFIIMPLRFVYMEALHRTTAIANGPNAMGDRASHLPWRGGPSPVSPSTVCVVHPVSSCSFGST